jgi:hypothetical protein
MIASCTPVAGSVRPFTVAFAPPPGQAVAALTLLVNYPEGRVTIPGSGPVSSTYFVPAYPPADVLIRGRLDHALRGLVADSTPVPAGNIFTVKFQDCAGVAPPTAAAFTCTVLDASDAFSTPVPGVTCSVSAG